MVEDHIDAMELLKEELSNDEIPYKVNAIHRLPTVIFAIGPIQTHDKLIPFIDCTSARTRSFNSQGGGRGALRDRRGAGQDLRADREQAAAAAFAGGPVQHCRDRGARAGGEILVEDWRSADQLGHPEHLCAHGCATRYHGGSSLPSVLHRPHLHLLQPLRKPERSHAKVKLFVSGRRFGELCKEETPLIRKTCASTLGVFAEHMEKELIVSDLIPSLKLLITDEQDSIRMICVGATVSIAKILPKDESKKVMLPITLQIFEDKSWKVRLAIAKNFPELAGAFGKDIVDGNLVTKFSLLLKDDEADVRTAAIIALKSCLKNISADKIQTVLIPQLGDLMKDSSFNVRAGLAVSLCSICTAIKKEVAIAKLLPLLVDLLKDEHHEVKMGVLAGIQPVANFIGPEFITSSMLMSFSNLMKDQKWRVRNAVLDLLGNLAKEFGKDFYAKNIEQIFLQFLTDAVAAVRDTGIAKVELLANTFKADWVLKVYLPRAIEAFNKDKQGYLYRVTALKSMAVLVFVRR
eukprot:TRINITY_DN3186_c0_g1_i1.p1 TRINITY_DN3186_c0_g1~~TRINITY_DN3186_c0_g1_i1.p1  ORF type:complete len:520 (+),score=94.15 TRINITY_DN3186_c0_g1_i1:285-1844(+)